MTAEADITAPRDPATYARKGRAGIRPAMVAAAVAAALVAGWLVGILGPRPAPGPLLRPPVEAPGTAAAEPPLAPPAPAPSAAPKEPAPPAPGAVEERLGALERDQARTTRAAAAALAAAALMDAARGSGAFSAELATLRAVAPTMTELQGLEPLARVGAPSRSALVATFPEYAARAVVASRAPGEGAGPLARIGHALSRIVTLRRVGETPGSGPDATVARAERQVEDGDVERAVRTLHGLPPAGREAMGPWLARAERRTEIDRRVAVLRAQALAELSRAGAAGSRP